MDHNEQSEEDLCHEDLRHERSFLATLKEAPGSCRIEKFEAIVEARAIMFIEEQPVDLFSANTVVQVYKALQLEKNKVNFMSSHRSIAQIVDLAFKVVAKTKQS